MSQTALQRLLAILTQNRSLSICIKVLCENVIHVFFADKLIYLEGGLEVY